jgi:hypothetical protein
MGLPDIKIEVRLSWIIERIFPIINRLPQLTTICHFCGHSITDWGKWLLQCCVLGFLISVRRVIFIWIKLFLTFWTIDLPSRSSWFRVNTYLSGHLTLETLIIRSDWHLLHSVVPSSRDYPRIRGDCCRLSIDATARVAWFFEILAAVRTAFLDSPGWIKLLILVIRCIVISWSVHFSHSVRTVPSLRLLPWLWSIAVVKGRWRFLFWFADAGK